MEQGTAQRIGAPGNVPAGGGATPPQDVEVPADRVARGLAQTRPLRPDQVIDVEEGQQSGEADTHEVFDGQGEMVHHPDPEPHNTSLSDFAPEMTRGPVT